MTCKFTLEGLDNITRIGNQVADLSQSNLTRVVYNDEPFFVIKTEEVCCYVRPRAFRRIMRYERLFLLVLLVGVLSVTFGNGILNFS